MGVNADNLNESLAVIRDELAKLGNRAVSATELANAKDYAQAGLLLAADNLEMRMTRIARNELYYGRDVSFDEVLAELAKVSAEDVRQLAARLFDRGMTAAVLGPVADRDVEWHYLAGTAAA
ncbi:MAG: insulinase family protein, partial [Deltaproteobacteria bacterium]|nr:insulinase family protein [Deltaproteobacteria bacterium]